ncbi:hypothetical protein SAMN05428970_2534 [Agromyces sp. CF514]|nr:hypothetical protein [Agromyces sp. CF514]SFR79341.1 hypothetical protein SAMN05428970_2534 [Agromyces sp. CF514]
MTEPTPPRRRRRRRRPVSVALLSVQLRRYGLVAIIALTAIGTLIAALLS